MAEVLMLPASGHMNKRLNNKEETTYRKGREESMEEI
jgi:hypothetical protein